MGVIYLGALIVGLGTMLLQLFLSGDAEADADLDHDLSLDGDVDADAGGHDVHHGGGGGGGMLPILLSLRFWTFALLAFGLVGTPIHYLGLATSLITLLVAGALGLGSGFAASWTFQALARATTQSGGQVTDAVGQVGKVLLPCARGSRGKVRIQLRGQTVDYLAITEEEEIAPGEMVLIEQVEDETVRVSRAPAEFLGDRGGSG